MQVGFLHGAIKSVDDARVGDTITLAREPAPLGALPGYAEPVPMVYCGLFPVQTTRPEPNLSPRLHPSPIPHPITPNPNPTPTSNPNPNPNPNPTLHPQP